MTRVCQEDVAMLWFKDIDQNDDDLKVHFRMIERLTMKCELECLLI